MAVGLQILKVLKTITCYCRTENVRTFITKAVSEGVPHVFRLWLCSRYSVVWYVGISEKINIVPLPTAHTTQAAFFSEQLVTTYKINTL